MQSDNGQLRSVIKEAAMNKFSTGAAAGFLGVVLGFFFIWSNDVKRRPRPTTYYRDGLKLLVIQKMGNA